MADDSLTSKFQEKLTKFTSSLHAMTENQKLPQWFKPFMESFKNFAIDISDTFDEIQKDQAKLEGFLAIQKSVTDALEADRNRIMEELQSVQVALEDQRQYTRRNMLLVHGVDEVQGKEDTDQTVLKIINDVLKVPIAKNDINRSHRLGGKKSDAKRRPIIVSFLSYGQRKLVFDNKKKLRGSKTVVTESLTKSRYALLQKCQVTYGRENCWTYDGRIYCVQDETKFCVTNEVDLAEQRI